MLDIYTEYVYRIGVKFFHSFGSRYSRKFTKPEKIVISLL